MNFLLDTDTCIFAMRRNISVLSNLLAKDREQIVVSAITEAELRTGAAKSGAPLKTLRLVQRFLAPITIVDFTSDDAIAYAQIRADLERAGKSIGPLDTLIAAQGVARKLTLVTNNVREFGRVKGLDVENWAG
jgi:tRNA(fMet)-specific endonuclease VapC